MEDALAMAIFGLKSAGDVVIRKMITTICSIPKRILKVLFGIQIKMIYIAFDCLVRIYRVTQNRMIFKYIFPEKVSNSEPVVDQNAVVKGVKKVRRALCVSLEQYYGLDVKSDMDLIQERLDEVHKCMESDDEEKIFEALASLRDLNKPFEDGSWRDKYITDLEVCEYTDDDSETGDKPTNLLEKPKCDNTQVASNISKQQEVLNTREIKRDEQLDDIQLKRSRKNKCPEKGALQNRLTITNAKLEEVLKMSSNLVGELTRLNSHVSQLAVVSERMAAMQYELGEGRKLLWEIEADRNEMKTKLSILGRMIQEEEQYLDDVSCESGYDEGETQNYPEV